MNLSKLFVYLCLVFFHIDVVLSGISSGFLPSELSSSCITPAGENGTSSSGWRSVKARNKEDQDPFEFEYLVTGGYRKKVNNFLKHTVSLRYYKIKQFFGDNHFCAGAIIHRKCIITAAHCLFKYVAFIRISYTVFKILYWIFP